MSDTNIESLGVDKWRKDLLDSFPSNYVSKDSKLKGGGTYGLFSGMAANLQMINDYLVYAFDAARIQTATGEALDLCAVDYYGINGLPRKTAESDDSYRARIMAGLFIPYTTKEAFVQAITALTGVAPVLVEGWRVDQTSAYDWSYYDVNIPERPGLYGDTNLPYQVFVTATLPSPTGQQQATAIWGYDAGAGYDIYTGTYWNLKAGDFIGQSDLDALINRIKAFGITVWRKYITAGSAPFLIASSFAVTSGQSIFNPSVQPFSGQYVVIASGNWNSAYWVDNILRDGFTINTSAPSIIGSRLSFIIVPTTSPDIQGVGSLGLAVGATKTSIPTPVSPAAPGNRVAVTPNWNTNAWITALVEVTGATVGGTVTSGDSIGLNVFDAGLPGGHVNLSYTALMSDSLSDIATNLTALVNANANLMAIGVTATSGGPDIALKSASPNTTTYSATLLLGATETLTFSRPASLIDMHFSAPAPAAAQLSYMFAPPAQSALYYLNSADIASESVNIPIPNLPACAAFITPSWNTSVATDTTANSITGKFGSTPPSGAFIQWSYYPLAGG